MELTESLSLIDLIIEELRKIFEGFQNLEQVANDAEALVTLNKASETFMPGRLKNNQAFQKLQELHAEVDEGLNKHFNREENQLLAAFQNHGDERLLETMQTLLLEHKDIKNRLDQEKKYMVKLVSGKLSRHLWEATAYDLRAHIAHTRRLLEAHAEIEQELLRTLRKEITEA